MGCASRQQGQQGQQGQPGRQSDGPQACRQDWRELGALPGVVRSVQPVQPVALALAADAAGFRQLRRLGLFALDDFARYLRRTERQLRAMAAEGVQVHLRVLEAADYADFCRVRGLPLGEPATRVAYAADPELAGEPFVYRGEELAELLPQLVDDHLARVRISVARQLLLAAPGPPGGPARYAAVLCEALLAGVGEGCHEFALRVAEPDGTEQLTAQAQACVERGRRFLADREAQALRATLAAALAVRWPGELLVRSARRHGRPRAGGWTVRGWAVVGGRLVPLEADAVRAELARLPSRGPAAGPVRVRAGFALPEPSEPPGSPSPGSPEPLGRPRSPSAPPSPPSPERSTGRSSGPGVGR
ncbi:hypothetical protein [Kitasatospora nipponensis]